MRIRRAGRLCQPPLRFGTVEATAPLTATATTETEKKAVTKEERGTKAAAAAAPLVGNSVAVAEAAAIPTGAKLDFGWWW